MTGGRSGDEPMLPRQHDNAPMIGGPAVKRLKRASWAYESANMKTLLTFLDEAQQERFRELIARQAIDMLERNLVVNYSAYLEQCLEQVRAASRLPDSERAAAMWAVPVPPRRWDEAQAVEYAAGVIDPQRSIEQAVQHAKDLLRALVLRISASESITDRRYRLVEVLHQWHLSTVWALVQHIEPPVFPELYG
jgi:hypothetical protein